MHEEDFIISHRDEEEVESNQNDQNSQQKQPDFRFLIITTTPSSDADAETDEPIQVTTENVDEFILSNLESLDAVNALFDEFDSKIAYPNEGHIKYEVGSDGLCVIIVDSVSLKASVVEFVQSYGAISNDSLGNDGNEDIEEGDEGEEDEEEERDNIKRRK